MAKWFHKIKEIMFDEFPEDGRLIRENSQEISPTGQ